MSAIELTLASLHEAGHAVAIVVTGGFLEAVTLSQTIRGDTTPLPGDADDPAPWTGAVCALAGAAAARLLGPGSSSRWGWREGAPAYLTAARAASAQDVAVARSHLARIGRDDRAGMESARRGAEALVLEHDADIRRVAAALRERGALDHQDVAECLSARTCERLDALHDAMFGPAGLTGGAGGAIRS